MTKAINTDRELYALRTEAARYERAVTKARGLSVLIYPNGTKSLVVRYVAANGARRRLPIGDYPALSLAEARLKASAVRLEMVSGEDPAAERAAVRVEARFGETLEDLAEGYWKAAAIGLHGGRKRPLRPRTLERQKGLWDKHVKPALGSRPFRELRRAEIRIGDVLRALFTYALHEDLVEGNPTLGLTRPVVPESRSRRFGDDALGVMLAAILDAAGADEGRQDPHARMAPVMALGLQYLVLTLTRREETAGASWPECGFRGPAGSARSAAGRR